MKRNIILLSAAALLACSCQNNAPELTSHSDTLSWVMGQNIGIALKEGSLNDRLDNDLVIQAIKATLDDAPMPLTDEEYMAAFEELVYAANTASNPTTAATKAEQDMQQTNIFEQLKSNPDIKQHESGFLYECVKPGKGACAKPGEVVRFDYQSRLLSTGEVFDDSHGMPDDIVAVLGSPMFPALVDAFQLMNTGSTYRFYFPYEMTQGISSLPKYTPVVYEVELYEITK